MYLRPSDFYMQLLRPVGVRTRHMAPLEQAYSAGVVSDSVAVGLRHRSYFFFGGFGFGGSSFGGVVV